MTNVSKIYMFAVVNMAETCVSVGIKRAARSADNKANLQNEGSFI